METDNTNHIIEAHLKKISRNEKSKIGVLSLSLGIVAMGAIGIMGLHNPKTTEISKVDQSTELIIEDEEVRATLVADNEEVEVFDIVATISPTTQQLDKLKESEEGRKIINENKKRNHNPNAKKEKTNEIGLTEEEVMMLEEAEILGAEGQVFKESELTRTNDIILPVPFNNKKVGISTRTYSADEVKELHTVHTGIVKKKH